MRALAVSLLIGLLVVPGALGEQNELGLNHEGCDEGPEHEECHDDMKTPGPSIVGVLLLVGTVVAFLRRK